MCESNPFTPDQLRKGYTQLVVGLRNSSSTLPPLVLLLFSCCLLCVYGMSEKHLRISLACRIIVVVAALFICLLLLLLLLLFFFWVLLGRSLAILRSLSLSLSVCYFFSMFFNNYYHTLLLTHKSVDVFVRVYVCVYSFRPKSLRPKHKLEQKLFEARLLTSPCDAFCIAKINFYYC